MKKVIFGGILFKEQENQIAVSKRILCYSGSIEHRSIGGTNLMKKRLLMIFMLFCMIYTVAYADTGGIPEHIFIGLSTVLDNQQKDNPATSPPSTQGGGILEPSISTQPSIPVDPAQTFNSKVEYKRDRNNSVFTLNLIGLENAKIQQGQQQIVVEISDQVLEQNGLINIMSEDKEVMDRLITTQSFVDGEGINNFVINLRNNVTYTVNQNAYGIIFNLHRAPSAVPRIVIDPGHGGHDLGATSPTTKVHEKDLALRTSLALRDSLVQKGYEVVMTRDHDFYPTLTDRAALANDLDADMFISIHYNSVTLKKGVTSHPAHGIETWVPHTPDNKALAEPVQRELIAQTGANNRGLKKGEKLVVLKRTKVPAILVELGFFSNANESRRVLEESYQQALVSALSTGIDRYFGR